MANGAAAALGEEIVFGRILKWTPKMSANGEYLRVELEGVGWTSCFKESLCRRIKSLPPGEAITATVVDRPSDDPARPFKNLEQIDGFDEWPAEGAPAAPPPPAAAAPAPVPAGPPAEGAAPAAPPPTPPNARDLYTPTMRAEIIESATRVWCYLESQRGITLDQVIQKVADYVFNGTPTGL